MRALRSDGQTLRLVADAATPEPPPGEALVQPSRVLLTPADVQGIGRGVPFVGTLGHLFVGVVRSVNLPADSSNALASRRSLVGRRVVASPVVACGQCDMCRSGLSSHCRTRQVPGLWGRDGACAELVAMPVANLHPLPDSLDDDRAVFAPIVAAAAHTANMLRAENRQYVSVLGDSPLALLTAQALARQNRSVRVLSADSNAARLCEQWGMKHRPTDEPGRRQDQDAVVDCTGSAAGLRLAMQLARPRAVIMLKSVLADAPFPAGRPFPTDAAGWSESLDLTPVVTNELRIIGSRDGPLPAAIDLLATGEIDVDPLAHRRFKLDQGPAAADAAANCAHLAVLVEDLGPRPGLARAA